MNRSDRDHIWMIAQWAKNQNVVQMTIGPKSPDWPIALLALHDRKCMAEFNRHGIGLEPQYNNYQGILDAISISFTQAI